MVETGNVPILPININANGLLPKVMITSAADPIMIPRKNLFIAAIKPSKNQNIRKDVNHLPEAGIPMIPEIAGIPAIIKSAIRGLEEIPVIQEIHVIQETPVTEIPAEIRAIVNVPAPVLAAGIRDDLL